MAEQKEKPAKKEKAAKGEAKTHETVVRDKGITARLGERYKKDVVPMLMKRFQYKSVMQVPRLEKIAINVGVGQATQDPKILDVTVRELEQITGQKVAITKAKKAISNFKLREGLPIGARVTLRRGTMYEFLDRLISVALPRVRDFRGLPDKSFDGHGNYTLGVKEQIIFPEIDVDKVSRITGMDITFVTTANTDVEAYELLKELGMPFVKRQDVVQSAT
jgi:large subunit ribosomal protein L5